MDRRDRNPSVRIQWVDLVIGVPPQGVEDGDVENTPQSAPVAEPEAEQLIEIVEFESLQPPLCPGAQVLDWDRMVLTVSASLAARGLRQDLFPRQPFHLGQELDDLLHRGFGDTPRPTVYVLQVEERQPPRGFTAVRSVIEPSQPSRPGWEFLALRW